jgi:hypothetical protein
MRFLLVAVLTLGVAGVAMANNDLTNELVVPDKAPGITHGGADGREGGEDIANAFIIPSLPFSDTGNTCDNIHDYDEVCPYTGSASPDVVYAYAPTGNESITIDLCASLYDTKVFVYENAATPGAPFACNDDAGCGYSGYQSRLENINLSAGNIYYIVIDGYGSDCGDYILDIEGFEPCVVDCGSAPAEGEPPLVENYVDNYNGGCNSTPAVFQTLEANAAGVVELCGRSGTYLYFGSQYRDTDWFIVTAGGPQVLFNVTPEFPVFMFELFPEDCATVAVNQQASPLACETGSLTIPTFAGDEIWLWVGPQVFSGLPEFTYLMEVAGCEPGGSTPVDDSTWGTIKSMYQ